MTGNSNTEESELSEVSQLTGRVVSVATASSQDREKAFLSAIIPKVCFGILRLFGDCMYKLCKMFSFLGLILIKNRCVHVSHLSLANMIWMIPMDILEKQ